MSANFIIITIAQQKSNILKKNIDFDMAIYTNKNHGIYGGYTRLHLFNKMLKYTQDNL